MPAKKRYKIERKVREHNRSVRKTEKVKARGKQKKKLITVPGDCPFKAQILGEAIALRESISQAKLARREEVKVRRKEKRASLLDSKRGLDSSSLTKTGILKLNALSNPAPKQNGPSFDQLLKKAEARGYFFEKVEETTKGQTDSSLKAFYREFQQVGTKEIHWLYTKINRVLP
jgi:nuclear GTP-binding protein